MTFYKGPFYTVSNRMLFSGVSPYRNSLMVDNDICDNKIDVKLKIHLKVGPCHTECRWVPGVILAKVDGLISLQIAIHRPVMII